MMIIPKTNVKDNDFIGMMTAFNTFSSIGYWNIVSRRRKAMKYLLGERGEISETLCRASDIGTSCRVRGRPWSTFAGGTNIHLPGGKWNSDRKKKMKSCLHPTLRGPPVRLLPRRSMAPRLFRLELEFWTEVRMGKRNFTTITSQLHHHHHRKRNKGRR